MKILGLTSSETSRLELLKRELFKGCALVEVDFNNPQWVEYNELIAKMLKADKHIKESQHA